MAAAYTADAADLNDATVREAIIRTELQALAEEQEDLDTYRDYYSGEQKLRFGTTAFQERFGSTFEGFRDNWCKVVVDAVADKMEVTGIRVGQELEEIEKYQALSKGVWKVCLDNDIDDKQASLHEGVLVEGRGALILWPDAKRGFTLHWNPAQVIRVRYSDEDPNQALWAVKRWVTSTGAVLVTLYTPDYLYKYTEYEGQRAETQSNTYRTPIHTIPELGSSGSLMPRRINGEEWPLSNPLGVVPVVEFLNGDGRSDIADVVPMQDAINYTWMQMMTAGEFMAVPQRVMVTKQREPVGGWHNDPGRIWHLEPMTDQEGRLINPTWGAFEAYDPTRYIQVIQEGLKHIANTSKTPMRLFEESERGGRGDAPSGESLKVEDKPLLDKVRKLSTRLGNRWYQIVRMGALALAQNPTFRADLALPGIPESVDDFPSGEVIWRDIRLEYRSAAIADGTAMLALGLPKKFIWREIGLSEEELVQVEEWAEEEKEEAEEEAQQELEAQVEIAEAGKPKPSTDGVTRSPQNRTGPRPSNT